MLGGLALGLVLSAAAAAASGAPQYSGVALPRLASVQSAQSSLSPAGKLRVAENEWNGADEEAAAAEARKRLKRELERMRGERESAPEPQTPKPAKPKQPASSAESKPKPQPAKQPATSAEVQPKPQPGKQPAHSAEVQPKPQPEKQPAPAIDPAINRAVGKLLVMRFTGTQPSDGGPKAIRALLQQGHIAGAMFASENIHTRTQIKELMKFFWQGGSEPKPIFAISEIGGPGDGLPRTKDFESWPSEQQVASKGDPEYAYATYRSLSSYLAGLGFTMNFGPALGAAPPRNPAASFGPNPLQSGVFAKAFVIGHTEDKIVAVPIVDGGEGAIRALKTLLVSYPAMPVASVVSRSAPPPAAHNGLVRGARFCLAEMSAKTEPAEAADYFTLGCDALVVDPGKESPSAIRDIVAKGVANAIKKEMLSAQMLEASAKKLQGYGAAPPSGGQMTRTSQ
jgi:hypothetical protein